MIAKSKKSKMSMLRKLSIVPVIVIALFAFSVKAKTTEPVNLNTGTENVVQNDNPWTSQNDLESPVIIVGYGGKANANMKDASEVSLPPKRKLPPKGVIRYNDVEEKPSFKHKDAESGFREYLAKNARYPAVAQENGYVGKVIVSFIVNENGKVVDVDAEVKANPLLAEEIIRVVKSSPNWVPGKQKGSNVPVQCYVFTEFKLNNTQSSGTAKKTSSVSKSNVVEDDIVFIIVEKMPLFNGKKAEEGFREYVESNLNYPAAAKEKGISGRVFVI